MYAYYKDDLDIIYKFHKGGWLILSPIKEWNHRFVEELPSSKQIISKKKADTILAQQWKPIKRTWTYCGETFMVHENNSKMRCYGKSYEFGGHNYFIGFYRGKLIWYYPYQSSSSCQYYVFIDENKAPGKFIGWVQMNNIKPIYNKTKGCWV